MDAASHLASLAKPPESLGLLETWAQVLCIAQNTLKPQADPGTVLVFTADHGIKKADDALSPFPAIVSQAVFRALAAGISGTAILARSVGAHLTVIDAGIDGDVSEVSGKDTSISVRHAKVAHGTADCRSAPAMDDSMLVSALKLGSDCVADEVSQRGAKVVAIGEVGIGNTTSAAALLSALTGADAAECCGRGTGLDDAGLVHKVTTVRAVCALHAPDIAARGQGDAAEQAREALRRVGGLELAAMCGAYIEASRLGVVAVVDGFISAVAALCAVRIQPACRKTMVFATALAEEPTSARGGELLAAALGAEAALSMGLRLGEASGGALSLPLLRAAAAIVGQMGTLEDALALGK